MTDEDLYRLAYNAHEGAEHAALEALDNFLRAQSIEALSCLCDPQWGWESRGWISEVVIDFANEALNERLDAAVAA